MPSRISIGERLLLFLSRKPEAGDYEEGIDHWDLDNALSNLCRDFPGFLSHILDREILDYGCGTGFQTVALARNGAKYVVGIDINREYLQKGRSLAQEFGVQDKVEFLSCLDDRRRGRFDMVISQNSMEHFPEPEKALEEMGAALNPRGKIFVTFACPWLSPYGSHMHFFTKIPWVNILFDEKTVMRVRARFRGDGATRYEDVEGGLNKMTVAKFERIVAGTRLQISHRRYRGVKGLDFLGKFPWSRELFINVISCVLSPCSSKTGVI